MTATRLEGLQLFEGLASTDRQALSQVLIERKLQPGEVLFVQGDPAGSCFVVIDGTVDVEIDVAGRGREPLSVLTEGDLFGEVALLDGGPRSATCAAGPDGARVAEVPRAEFDRLYKTGDASACHLMDIILDRLVVRLRDATRLLVEVAAE